MLQQKNLFWAKKEKLEEDGTKSQFTDATIDESV